MIVHEPRVLAQLADASEYDSDLLKNKMAYDEELAERIRKLIRRRKGVTERKMFGGIAFMLNGNMCCGVVDRDLVLRLGKEKTAKALNEPHTRPMNFTGKTIKSMIYVMASGIEFDDDLKDWLNRAIAFARTLQQK